MYTNSNATLSKPDLIHWHPLLQQLANLPPTPHSHHTDYKKHTEEKRSTKENIHQSWIISIGRLERKIVDDKNQREKTLATDRE
ncbi:MAG: hypothetical protein AB7J46_01305 [Candidatus Altimarinota bacterium]